MATVGDIYSDGNYLANNPGWHAVDSAWKAAHATRLLRRHGVEPATMVEVGCGAGGVIAAMARDWPASRATGFDISPDAARLWPRHRPANLAYVRGDFLATDARYDLLLLMDVFEHVDDYLGFLRALRPRASRFIFHIPLEMSLVSLLTESYMRGRVTVGHLHYFTHASALATLATAGYAVRDWQFTALATEASRDVRTWRTRVLNVPRRIVAAAAPRFAATIFGGYSMIVIAERDAGASDAND